MDEDGGSGEAVALSDIFYENSEGSPMATSSPEPASPTMSEPADVKPALRPSIIVPHTKSKLILIFNNWNESFNIKLFSRRQFQDRAEPPQRSQRVSVCGVQESEDGQREGGELGSTYINHVTPIM